MSPLAHVRNLVEPGQLKDLVHSWVRIRGQHSLDALECVKQDNKNRPHDVEDRGHRGPVCEPISWHHQLLPPYLEPRSRDVGGDDQG